MNAEKKSKKAVRMFLFLLAVDQKLNIRNLRRDFDGGGERNLGTGEDG